MPAPGGLSCREPVRMAVVAQCTRALIWRSGRPPADRRPGTRIEGREPHRAAIHRRFRGRPALSHIGTLRLDSRRVSGAVRRWPIPRRLSDHQRRTLCSTAEQTDRRRVGNLPLFPRGRDRGTTAAQGYPRAGHGRPRFGARGAGAQKELGAVSTWRDSCAARRDQACRQLSLLTLQHEHWSSDRGYVCPRVRDNPAHPGLIGSPTALNRRYRAREAGADGR